MVYRFGSIVLFALLSIFSYGQSVPRFVKYELGAGMKAYLPAEPSVDHSQSEDKSDV
jgi:hypothetical protein